MFLYIISFVSGTILLQWQRMLPDPLFFWLIPPLCYGFIRYRVMRIPAAFVIGFLWAALAAQPGQRQIFPFELRSRDIVVTGTVSSLPDRHQRYVAFEFATDAMEYRGKSYPGTGMVKLRWYSDKAEIRAGERWRLKPPHGFMNPGGFDYEGRLFHRGIRARGYVRADSLNQRLGEGDVRFSLLKVRQHIGSVIDRQLQQGKAAGLFRALVIGDRGGMSASDWDLFRRTGTNHLVTISGLHIGIVGGLGYYLVSIFWRNIPRLALLVATPKAAATGALMAGAGYAALAGFSIPTQRALIMLAVVTLGVVLQARFRSYRSLGMALLIVVALDPAAVLAPGFWLSFVAVGVIFIGVSQRAGRARVITSWCRIQWLIGLGLAPALLFWQQQVPLIAPLVNMLAVPLFSLLIIPLSLAGTLFSLISPDWGYTPMVMADWLLDSSRSLLALAARSPFQINAPPDLPGYVWALAVCGVLLLLLPGGIPARVPGFLMLLPLILHAPVPTPRAGEFRFTLLDVGQGMAAVVQTRRHVLVYDTGPAYSKDFNAGSEIVAPFLLSRGISRIDRLILSNGDSDHQGGVTGLQAKIRIDEVLSGEPARIIETNSAACVAGMSWSWDGVIFTILHPDIDKRWRGNNASCVVRIENAAGSVLLTGDIESAAEQRLVTCCRAALMARLVTMPHHGSATSSGVQFVQAVGAEFALAPTGFLNQYGFPKNEVVSRWQAQGALVLNTALTGAVEFHFSPELGITGPDKYRYRASRYWTHLPVRNSGSH